MKRLVVLLTLLLSLLVWSPAQAASVSKVTLSSAKVAGGGTVTATVTLASTATSTTLVTMSSSSTYATVQNVSVASGKKSATVKVVTTRTSTQRTAVITAAIDGVSRSVNLTIDDLALVSVSASPLLLTSESSVVGTVKINGAADPGGYVVSLSSNSSLVTVPSTVVVPSGKLLVTFPITSRAVTASATVVVTATAGGITKTGQLTVSPLVLTRLSSSTTITGGNPATGKITLNGKATTGGATVTLSSSNPSLASVPSSATVPVGLTSVTFPVTTSNTLTERTVTLTASYRGVFHIYVMTIKPVVLSSLSITPSSLISTQGGNLKVTVTGPAPSGDLVVTLSSGDPDLIVPATATVLAGTTSVTVPVTTGAFPLAKTVSVTGTLGAVSKTIDVKLTPITLMNLTTLQSATGGNRAELTLILNAPAPSGGIVVSLASSDAATLSLPTTVMVDAGLRSVVIDIYPAVVTVDKPVTLTASESAITKSVVITIKPARFQNMGLNPSSVTAGRATEATLTLTGPAPVDGLTINLSASVTSPVAAATAPVTLPASVFVPAGARFVRISALTTSVSVKTVIGIRAWTYDTGPAPAGSTDAVTARLTVEPPVLQDFHPRPVAVTPGGQAPIIIRLTGPAPTGGVLVTLSSSVVSVATVPASVTIPAGARSISVNVTGTAGAAVGSSSILSVTALGKTLEGPATVSNLLLTSLTLSVPRVVGGNTLTGTVTLNGDAPAGGAAVGLNALDPAITLPGSVVIPTGSRSATFTINTALIQSPKSVVIYAQYSSIGQTADLFLDALGPLTLVLDDNDIEGGETVTGTITLNAKTPPNGFGEVIALVFASPSKVSFPATVTMGPATTTATFTITGIPVAVDTRISMVVEVNGRSTSNALLTIHPPRVQSLSIATATVTGGTSNTGTVTLTSPAPAGGWQVDLSSGNAAAIPVTSVVVPAGLLSASFAIGTIPVAVDTTPVITAARNGTSATASFLIKPPRLTALAVNDSDLEGGFAAATGTVTLNGPAPTGGWTIALASSSAASATGPASVTVAAGATTATFAIASAVVPSDVTAVITATKFADSFSQSIIVRQIKVTGLTISPSSVQGGDAATATVTINRSVPTLGVTVALTSGGAAATMPGTILIPVGTTSATINVTTLAVATDTTVRLTASFNGGSAGVDLLVLAPVVTAVSAAPSPIIGGWATSTGTVTISHLAPVGGFTVDLSASNGGGGVPATVVIPAGSTVASFTITTTVVANDRSVTITAARNLVSRTTVLVVRPLIVSALSILPGTVDGGGQDAIATVTLNGNAPVGGVVVTLGSDHTSHATAPVSVAVAAGTSSATFTVTSIRRGGPRLVTVTATYNATSRTATLQVNPPLLDRIDVSPGTVAGGASVTGTVRIGAAAGTDGYTVALSSNTAFALVPVSVVVASGQTEATFTITTLPLAVNRTVTITATANGLSKTDTFVINPPDLLGITLSASPVLGGTTLTATATISSAAPTGGLTVTMSSNKTQAAPVNIVIAAGQTQGTANVTTQGVYANTTVVVTGAFNGTSRTASFQINKTTLAAVEINPDVVEGGVNTNGTIYLNGVAPVGGVSVGLSDGSSVVTTASSVTVPAGASQVDFFIDTDPVGSTQTKTLSAVYDGVTVTHGITLLAD